MPVSSTNLANDAGKYIQDKLIARSNLLQVITQFAEKIPLEKGMAKTVNMLRYERMAMPMAAISEGVTPDETPFSIATQSVTTDQWGQFIALTDVSLVTTKHPVLQEALKLLGDSVSRVQDFVMYDALMAGTNVQYLDGTVASRAALVAANVFVAAVFNKARATLNDAGSPPREGNVFVAVMGPQVEADIVQESANNSFASFNSYAGKIEKLEQGVIGTWLGFRCVRTNFIPKFSRHGNQTAAVLTTASYGANTPVVTAVDGGGTLVSGATHYWKSVRKSVQRGFSEEISIEHTMAAAAAANNESFTFEWPAGAGYVYDLYFGTASGDANLWLVASNALPSTTTTVTTAPASGAHPPASPSNAATAPVVHPIFCFSSEAVDMVDQSGMSMMGAITPATASDSDPLVQRRKVGSKFMQKAGIRDSNRLLRIELCSNF